MLVPGDIVRLSLGDRVPADLRIIHCVDLKTECSSLTGESEAITACVTAQNAAPLEARNLVFSSSLVMNGEGLGVVTRTGDATMIGCIAALAAGSGRGSSETLLEGEIRRGVNLLARLAIVTAFVFFGIGMGRHQPVISTFINGVACAVAWKGLAAEEACLSAVSHVFAFPTLRLYSGAGGEHPGGAAHDGHQLPVHHRQAHGQPRGAHQAGAPRCAPCAKQPSGRVLTRSIHPPRIRQTSSSRWAAPR